MLAIVSKKLWNTFGTPAIQVMWTLSPIVSCTLTRVLNKYKDEIPSDAIYIGRGSVWGNPHVIGDGVTREDAVERYSEHIYDLLRAGTITVEDIAKLHGRDLVCYCAPRPCHGDKLKFMAKLAQAMVDAKVAKKLTKSTS